MLEFDVSTSAEAAATVAPLLGARAIVAVGNGFGVILSKCLQAGFANDLQDRPEVVRGWAFVHVNECAFSAHCLSLFEEDFVVRVLLTLRAVEIVHAEFDAHDVLLSRNKTPLSAERGSLSDEGFLTAFLIPQRSPSNTGASWS